MYNIYFYLKPKVCMYISQGMVHVVDYLYLKGFITVYQGILGHIELPYAIPEGSTVMIGLYD